MFDLIKKIIYKGRHFSWRLEWVLFLQYTLIHFFNEKSILIQYLYKKRDFYIKNYLIKKGYINTVITPDMITKKTKRELDSNCIWIYWAQGWDNPPLHVEFYKNSVLKNANGRKVILISDKNYRDYVNIPDYIEHKKKEGKITITHFSDILRFSLLADYGGLWLDASMFVMRPLKDHHMYKRSFYTIRLKEDFTNNRIISKARWVGSCMGSNTKNHKIFLVGRNFFFLYWMKEVCLINYFLIDYFFDIIFKLDESLKEELLKNNYFNQGIYGLYKDINKTDLNLLNKGIYLKTDIYYLSWKKEYKKEIDGKKTIYSYLIDKIKNS